MAETVEVKPWERQNGETAKQFEAFVIYRDMGEERSITAVTQKLNKSRALIGRWSSNNSWVERCIAWDREKDRLARLEQQKDIKKMRKRHANLAVSMLVKAAKALERIPIEEIKASDISKFVETASRLERVSRGDVGDVIEQRDGGEAMDSVQIYIPDNNRGRGNDDFSDLEV